MQEHYISQVFPKGKRRSPLSLVVHKRMSNQGKATVFKRKLVTFTHHLQKTTAQLHSPSAAAVVWKTKDTRKNIRRGQQLDKETGNYHYGSVGHILCSRAFTTSAHSRAPFTCAADRLRIRAWDLATWRTGWPHAQMERAQWAESVFRACAPARVCGWTWRRK